MGLTVAQARARIDAILTGYQRALGQLEQSVLPTTVAAGKTYEAWVLCDVLEQLHGAERYDVTLRASTKVVLKTGGGPINPAYSHFELGGSGLVSLEVWTDVEVLGMSAQDRGIAKQDAERCDYHELDIVVAHLGVSGRPWPEDLVIGVECKNAGYTKDMLRSMLGVRRELSLLVPDQTTGFQSWPRAAVPARPPSCLLAYSTDQAIIDFQPPGDLFGIDFVYEEM